jgi:hypothetical protein
VLGPLALLSAADAAVIASGNSTATVSDTDANLTVWRVDGGPDNVFLANFFFRTDTLASGNGGELKINGLSALDATPLGANAIRYSASDSELSAVQTWSLTGGSPGDGAATLAAVLTLTNISNRTIPLSLFYAADLDIAFDPANPNDETTALSASNILVRDPVTGAEILTQVDPSVDDYQIYQGQFEVLFNFNANTDGPTVLANSPAMGTTVTDVAGVVDAGFAFAWSIELAPGASITATASHVHSVVPEPASLVMIAAVVVLSALRSRQQ